jgi:hypothetical protein
MWTIKEVSDTIPAILSIFGESKYENEKKKDIKSELSNCGLLFKYLPQKSSKSTQNSDSFCIHIFESYFMKGDDKLSK